MSGCDIGERFRSVSFPTVKRQQQGQSPRTSYSLKARSRAGRGEARALTLHAANFPTCLLSNSPRHCSIAPSSLRLQHIVPPGRASRHAAITDPRHCRHQGHTHFFHIGSAPSIIALDPSRPGHRRKGRQGGCPHTEHRRCRLADTGARPPSARLQPRGLRQRPASEALPRS